MEPIMEVETKPELQDLLAFYRWYTYEYAGSKKYRREVWWPRIVVVGMCSVGVFALLLYLETSPIITLIGLVAMILPILCLERLVFWTSNHLLWRRNERWVRKWYYELGGEKKLSEPTTVSISQEGAAFRTETVSSEILWKRFDAVEQTPSHIFFVLGYEYGFELPRRSFENTDEAERFFREARRFWESAKQET